MEILICKTMLIKKIDCYLAKTIISAIFLVVLVLFGIEAFIEFTREFPDLGNGDYGLIQALLYVPMLLPTDIYQLFPMAGLLGCIIGLGLLASNSELIVMRIAGLSIASITLAVLKVALLLSLLMFAFGEVLAPYLQDKAATNKSEAISGGQALLTHRGMWLKNQDNFIHIGKIRSYERIEAITRYSFTSQNKLSLISFAESADYRDGQWIFNNVTQTNFNSEIDDDRVTTEQVATQQWGFQLQPRLLSLSSNNLEQKSLPELYRYIQYLKQSKLNYHIYEFNFWLRIFQPLTVMVMIILAIPFIFGPLRTATMGLRILVGTMTGFAFYIFNQFVGPLSAVYQISPFIAASLPTLIFAIVGGIFLRYS